MLFLLFLLTFFLCAFFLLCHYLVPPHGIQKTSLVIIAASLERPSTNLSKRPISVVIVFIVHIFKNPSKKFVLRGFTEPVKSLIIALVAPRTPHRRR
jgi:hypothetical protein